MNAERLWYVFWFSRVSSHTHVHVVNASQTDCIVCQSRLVAGRTIAIWIEYRAYKWAHCIRTSYKYVCMRYIQTHAHIETERERRVACYSYGVITHIQNTTRTGSFRTLNGFDDFSLWSIIVKAARTLCVYVLRFDFTVPSSNSIGNKE